MKRLATLALIVIVLATGLLLISLRLNAFSPIKPEASPVPLNHLARTPNSAYKYDLCVEAFAFAHALPTNPFKTNYSFHDPFRNASDTIIPLLMDQDKSDNTVSFKITIIVSQVATYTESISHVVVLDGISIMLPDKQGHLQKASEPQFIVSYLDSGGKTAVLDYTCSQEWHWAAVPEKSKKTIIPTGTFLSPLKE
ncbi:MAG TPA: hypothetical protein VF043_35145 [Ktedonobacteraceae bacterium]